MGYELDKATIESEKIYAADEYFAARQKLDSYDRRSVFNDGFERGWEYRNLEVMALQCKIDALMMEYCRVEMTDYKSMFEQAERTLAAIDEALGIGDDGCGDPDQTLTAIAELKAAKVGAGRTATVTRKMIGAAHDVMLAKGDFVLSANLLERVYLAMDQAAPPPHTPFDTCPTCEALARTVMMDQTGAA